MDDPLITSGVRQRERHSLEDVLDNLIRATWQLEKSAGHVLDELDQVDRFDPHLAEQLSTGRVEPLRFLLRQVGGLADVLDAVMMARRLERARDRDG